MIENQIEQPQSLSTPNDIVFDLMRLESLEKKIKTTIDERKSQLLARMQELGVKQLKTDNYTLSLARRVTPKVIDFETVKQSLEDKNIPYTVKEVFGDEMKDVFKQVQDLDGLEVKETEYLLIRPVKETT